MVQNIKFLASKDALFAFTHQLQKTIQMWGCKRGSVERIGSFQEEDYKGIYTENTMVEAPSGDGQKKSLLKWFLQTTCREPRVVSRKGF